MAKGEEIELWQEGLGTDGVLRMDISSSRILESFHSLRAEISEFPGTEDFIEFLDNQYSELLDLFKNGFIIERHDGNIVNTPISELEKSFKVPESNEFSYQSHGFGFFKIPQLRDIDSDWLQGIYETQKLNSISSQVKLVFVNPEYLNILAEHITEVTPLLTALDKYFNSRLSEYRVCSTAKVMDVVDRGNNTLRGRILKLMLQEVIRELLLKEQ